MVNILFAGLRNFRATIVCGTMLLFSLFVLINNILNVDLVEGSALEVVISFWYPYSLYAIYILIAYFLGLTYLTTLETLLDKLHHKTIMGKHFEHPNLFQNVLGLFAPFSKNAIKRIYKRTDEIISVSEKSDIILLSRSNTVNDKKQQKEKIALDILNDILWIEGRLVGEKMYDYFSKLLSDAEFRVGFSLILFPFTYSLLSSFSIGALYRVILLIGISVISIMILIHGLYHYRKAYSMLAHYVADGELETQTTLLFNKSTKGENNER